MRGLLLAGVAVASRGVSCIPSIPPQAGLKLMLGWAFPRHVALPLASKTLESGTQ